MSSRIALEDSGAYPDSEAGTLTSAAARADASWLAAQDFVLVQGPAGHAGDPSAVERPPGSVLWSWLAARFASWRRCARPSGSWAAVRAGSLRVSFRPHAPAFAGAVGSVLFAFARPRAARDGVRAGFIAGSSLPLEADEVSGVWRCCTTSRPLAIASSCAPRSFSLSPRPSYSGGGASTLAAQLASRPGCCSWALRRSSAGADRVFLPLAAWMHRLAAQRLGPAARGDLRDRGHRPSRCWLRAPRSRLTSHPTCCAARRLTSLRSVAILVASVTQRRRETASYTCIVVVLEANGR